MVTTTWKPSNDEVRRIVAELRPVIDACVARSRRLLAELETEPAARRSA